MAGGWAMVPILLASALALALEDLVEPPGDLDIATAVTALTMALHGDTTLLDDLHAAASPQVARALPSPIDTLGTPRR